MVINVMPLVQSEIPVISMVIHIISCKSFHFLKFMSFREIGVIS
jgi:hypothetical protein